MAGQVEMLLFLARSQSTGTREDVAIAECVNDAVQPLLAEIGRKGLSFENRGAPGASLRLNRQALDIVLTNLLRNAVAYTEHGHVRVSLDGSRLSVTDSGIGIAPAQLSQIFGRFRRGDGRRGFRARAGHRQAHLRSLQLARRSRKHPRTGLRVPRLAVLSRKAQTAASSLRSGSSTPGTSSRHDIYHYLVDGEKVMLDTIARSGLEPGEIDAVVKTGGSSGIPLFTEMLGRIFGREEVKESNAFTSVVAGLAIKAGKSRMDF